MFYLGDYISHRHAFTHCNGQCEQGLIDQHVMSGTPA